MEAKIDSKRCSQRPCRSPSFRSQKREETIEPACDVPPVSRDDGNGSVRVRIVVSRQQVRQMLAMMSGRSRDGAARAVSHPPTLEQLLHVLRRRHTKKADMPNGYRSLWRPALQSIPEEL